MRLRIFLVAAVVLTVFAVIASAADNALCLGSPWNLWISAAFLAFLADMIFGGWGYANGAWGRDAAGNPVS
jgi:hypothetical protein